MILTHEQAHTAHKIMLLALEGYAHNVTVSFPESLVSWPALGWIAVQGPKFVTEQYPTLADFATAYDVAGTAQRIEYTKAAQSWEAFVNYRADNGAATPPAWYHQFERLSVAGRVTKMVLGLWA